MKDGNGPGGEARMAAEKTASGETSWLERRLRQRREKMEDREAPSPLLAPRALLIAVCVVAGLYAAVAGWLSLNSLLGDGTQPAEDGPEIIIALSPEPPALPPDMTGVLREGAGAEPGSISPPGAMEFGTLPPPLTLPPDAPSRGETRITIGSAPAPGEPPARPAAERPASPLPEAPLAGLTADGKYGPLPVIGPDGKRPWQAYARPQAPIEGPAVALVVGGLGISETATAGAIDNLPPEVTLAFAPYGRNLQRWIDRARAAGHEVLLELPMEPFDYPNNDPGPYTLLTAASPADNLDRLAWLMSRFTGYAGVAPYQGARFTAEREAMEPVMEALASRGLAYLDTGAARRSVAADVARNTATPFAQGDRLIDPSLTASIIQASLEALGDKATESGTAIGIGSGFPVTVEKVSEWIGTLDAAGIKLIPVTAAIERKMENAR